MGDRRFIRGAFRYFGGEANHREDSTRVLAHLQERLILARAWNDLGISVVVLQCRGMAAIMRGDYRQAEEFYQEALSIAYKYKDSYTIIALLTTLGVLAQERENYAAAKKYYRRGLKLTCNHEYYESISSLLAYLKWQLFVKTTHRLINACERS